MLTSGQPIHPHLPWTTVDDTTYTIPNLGVYVATPAAPATWTLPALDSTIVEGAYLYIQNKGDHPMTLLPAAGNTIDGADSVVIPPQGQMSGFSGATTSWSKVTIGSYNGTTIAGGSFTIGVDFPTIQAGIDYVSNGIIPESVVVLNVPAGTYNEALFIDTAGAEPTWADPATDLTSEPRGLRIVGDTRPIANMTYVNGGVVRTAGAWATNSGQNSLGSLNGTITLSNVGNTLTVASTGTAPNFANCGVVAGDKILVKDSNGTFYERNVVSVSANTVTYDSTSVTITAQGATLTFEANVQVNSMLPDFVCVISGGAVEITGVWFRADNSISGSALYNVYVVGSGILYGSRLGIDARNHNLGQIGLLVFGGGRVLVNLADGDIVGHNTIVAGGLEVGNACALTQGDWYVSSRTSQGIAGFLGQVGSMSQLGSLQISSSTGGANDGVRLNANSVMTVAAAFNIFNASNGARNFASRLYVGNPTSVGTGASLLKGCTTAVVADQGALTTIVTALTIDTATTGLSLNRSSRVELGGALTLTTVTTARSVGFGCYLQERDNGTQQVGSHIKSQQTTVPGVVGSADLASATPTGSDAAGRIACTTSVGGVADSTLTITFNQAYVVAPIVTVTPQAASSAAMPTLLRVTSTSTTNCVISFTTPAGAGTAFTLNYIAVEL